MSGTEQAFLTYRAAARRQSQRGGVGAESAKFTIWGSDKGRDVGGGGGTGFIATKGDARPLIQGHTRQFRDGCRLSWYGLLMRWSGPKGTEHERESSLLCSDSVQI